jgi:hypothetical protein
LFLFEPEEDYALLGSGLSAVYAPSVGSTLVALAFPLFFAQAAGPAAPPDPAALSTVRSWLATLATKDLAKLRDASALPFIYVTDSKRKRCDGVARDEKSVLKTLKCLIGTEKVLIGELRYPDGVVLQGAEPKGSQPIGSYPSTVRKLADKLGTVEGQTTIEGYINGDGATFEFIFFVRRDSKGSKVSGLALHWEAVE